MRARRTGVATAIVLATSAGCSLFVNLDGLGGGGAAGTDGGGSDALVEKDVVSNTDASEGDAGSDATAAAYAAAVLVDHPIAYYHLDETSGPLISDSSGNKHDAKAVNNVTLGGAGAFAGSTAAHFDGNSFIEIEGTVNDAGTVFDFTNLSQFSLEAWVLLDQLAVKDTNEFTFFSKEKNLGGGNYTGLDFFTDPAVKLQREDDPTDDTEVNVPLAFTSAATWYYLVGTYDGDNLTIYLNGASIGTTQSGTEIPIVDVPFILGAETTGADSALLGSMDEVAIYDKPLGLSQMAAHYHAAGR